MAIKEDLKEEVKQEGGGRDELDALDALEKEAKEYDKVRIPNQYGRNKLKICSRMQRSIA